MVREQVVAAILDEAALIAVMGVAAFAVLALLGFKWYLALPVAVIVGFLLILLYKGVKAQLRRPLVGLEALVGKKGVVVESSRSGLVVQVEGELWKAVCKSCSGRLAPGTTVRVIGYEGLTLLVEPARE